MGGFIQDGQRNEECNTGYGLNQANQYHQIGKDIGGFYKVAYHCLYKSEMAFSSEGL